MKHLPPQDSDARDSFEAAVRNSTTALGRLREIIQEEIEALERQENSEKQFDQPNWEYKQAFWNGQRSKLQFLKSLLTFDRK